MCDPEARYKSLIKAKNLNIFPGDRYAVFNIYPPNGYLFGLLNWYENFIMLWSYLYSTMKDNTSCMDLLVPLVQNRTFTDHLIRRLERYNFNVHYVNIYENAYILTNLNNPVHSVFNEIILDIKNEPWNND